MIWSATGLQLFLFFEHQCRVWFGYPCEVWTMTTVPDLFFVPVNYIKCRVALSELKVNFGRVIGVQKVFVVSLLSDT